jgi:hypothetical protein
LIDADRLHQFLIDVAEFQLGRKAEKEQIDERVATWARTLSLVSLPKDDLLESLLERETVTLLNLFATPLQKVRTTSSSQSVLLTSLVVSCTVPMWSRTGPCCLPCGPKSSHRGCC